MVYLILGAVVGASLGVLSFGLLLGLRSASEDAHEGYVHIDSQYAKEQHDALSGLSRRVAEMEAVIPVIRGETAEALTRVDSRFNAARAAEERTRRIARNAESEEEAEEEAFLEQIALQEAAGAAEEDYAPAFDIDTLAFNQRRGGRR